MRTIIYGTGAIGGAIGGHLARVGYDVLLICRPAQAKAINERGLRLVTPTGTDSIHCPTVTTPGQISFKPDDVVFLCMKGQNTEEALVDLQRTVKDVPVFCFQNGVRNEEVASRYFERVYGVMVCLSASYLSTGEITAHNDPPGWFAMGCYPDGTDEVVESVAKELREAGFYVKATPEVLSYKWEKLTRNLGNIIGAITNVSGEEIEEIMTATRGEGMDIMRQAGIRWYTFEDMTKIWPEISNKPRANIGRGPQNSTWQSLTRGQSVETDYLNGEILRLAERLDLPAPINKKLVAISKEMASNHTKPGKHTPAQLKDLLGLP